MRRKKASVAIIKGESVMNESSDLQAFLRAKAKEGKDRPEVNWNLRKIEWLKNID
jgi:hypothetical protein